MIEIMNIDFELLGVITNYESLIFIRNFYEAGSFELNIYKGKNNTDKLVKGNMLIVDKDDNKILLIEKRQVKTDPKGYKTIVITGTCSKGITKRRLTITSNYDRVALTEAENIQKHYINNHFVDAHYDNIATPNRNIVFLKIAESKNRGIKTVWQSRFENVHDVLKHIGEDTGVGWNISLDRINKSLVFDSIEGENRGINQEKTGFTHQELKRYTHGQLKNYTHQELNKNHIKNPFVIFSDKKKNLIEGNSIDDNTNYKNVAYVGGKGENEDRLIIAIGEAEGIDRREVFIDYGNIEDPDELQQEGQKKLNEYKQIRSIEGKVYEIPNMEYGKDWFLGDIVTIETDDIEEDKRIIQVKEIRERGKELQVEVGFGDKVPGLIDEIKKMTNKPIA